MLTRPLDYVARCPHCEGIVCAMAGSAPPKTIAREVSIWIRNGLQLGRKKAADLNLELWGHKPDCSRKGNSHGA